MAMTELALLMALVFGAEKSVCVPNVAGDGWDCGKGEAAPAPRPLPSAAPQRQSSRPPIYLMNPEQMPQLVRESLERGDYATAEAASERLPPPPPIRAGEPTATASAPASETTPTEMPPDEKTDARASGSDTAATVPTSASAAEPLVSPPETMPAIAAEPTGASAPEPLMSSPETTPAIAAEPPVESGTNNNAVASTATADSSEPEASPSATVVAPSANGGAVGSEPLNAAPDPNHPTRSITSTALGAEDLLALPPDHYTVQLTAARSLTGFTELRQQLNLAVEDTFVILVKRGGESWWLMLWRSFPDVASARSAAATIGTQALWPRRLGPLQTEVLAAQGKGAGPQS